MKTALNALQRIFSTEQLKKAFIFVPVLFFLVYKLSSLEYRFGDQNAYFYMANAILEGEVPYRDFLLADPPLLVYLLALIRTAIGDNILLFSIFPPIFDALSSVFLYLYLKRKKLSFSFLAPAIYLFSFLIISTSDYVTGLHLVLFLINLALLFEKKPIISGVFWGLATLIKLYTIPGFLAFFVWLVIQKKYNNLLKTLSAYCLTAFVVMFPFLLVSPMQVINQIIVHQLNRPPGIPKFNVYYFFFVQDLLLIVSGIIGLIWKKNWQILLLLLSWLGFYLLFNDLYYVYLGILTPWLTIGLIDFLHQIRVKWQNDNLGYKIATSIFILFFLSHLPALLFYHQNTKLQGRFTQVDNIAQFILNLDSKFHLYGSHEVAPLIALITGRPLFSNYYDTNAQIYGSGAVDKKQVSLEAVEDGVYLLTKVTNLPINAKLDSGYEGYFDSAIFEDYCQRLIIIDGQQIELFSDVAIYQCKK